MHPVPRRCSSVEYCLYAPSSRLRSARSSGVLVLTVANLVLEAANRLAHALAKTGQTVGTEDEHLDPLTSEL